MFWGVELGAGPEGGKKAGVNVGWAGWWKGVGAGGWAVSKGLRGAVGAKGLLGGDWAVAKGFGGG